MPVCQAANEFLSRSVTGMLATDTGTETDHRSFSHLSEPAERPYVAAVVKHRGSAVYGSGDGFFRHSAAGYHHH